MLSRDEPSGYHLHTKICQYRNFYFIVTSIYSVNVYQAYRLGPGGLVPFFFLQRDKEEFPFFLEKFWYCLLYSIVQVGFYFSTQRSVIAAKWHFPTLDGVAVKHFSWGRAYISFSPDPHFLLVALSCQYGVFVVGVS